jgi:hypothetical protein
MAIEGPLQELSLSDVFQLLDLSRKTGTLTVRSDRRRYPGIVRFDRGAIVSAEYPGAGGRMGNLLLRAGKATESDIASAQAAQKERPGTPLGSMLLELGLVSEMDVKRQLRFQIQETVFELVRWTEGYFRFEETPPFDGGRVSLRVPTESLLMEAARRIDEWSTLEKKIPHLGLVPSLVLAEGETAPTLDLKPVEWEVLSEIDGVRSLRDIAREVGRSEFDVGKIVFGLLSTGVVTLDEAPETPSPETSALSAGRALDEAARQLDEKHYGAALQQLEQIGEGASADPRLHLLAGRALAGQQRWSEAVEALGRAAQLDPLATETWVHLGAAAMHTGQLARAEEAWRTYLKLCPAGESRRAAVEEALASVERLQRVMDVEALP